MSKQAPLRVACVAFHLCMRATQTAMATKSAGHSIHMVAHYQNKERQMNENFDSMTTFISQEQLVAGLQNVRPDIIHVHDRPHRVAADLIAAKKEWGVPIVHDVHDMWTRMVPDIRNDDDFPFEKASLQGADGLVFVSEANRAWAEKKYGPLPPSVVVHSAVLSRFFPINRLPRISAGVWGGGLYVEEDNSPRRYIDQREIIRRFGAVGQSAFIYYAPPDAANAPTEYRLSGAMLGGMEGYVDMLHAYTRYDFGWYGQTTDHDQIHDTLPNKLFEYIAAGIPVVVINARAAGEFVEKHGLGVHIRRPEDIIHIQDQLEAMRETLWRRRYEFTREKACEPLWALYEKLTGKETEEAARV